MNTKKLFKDYVLNTYSRVGPVFVKGKGSWLFDQQGKKYLDLFPGWGVAILGHSHPRIVKVICQQAKKLIHLPNNLYFSHQAMLAEEIVKNSFKSKVFFANSGAEAVEGMIKFSRLFGRERNRHELIVMKNSFHGRTIAAMSATAQKKYKQPFKPILPNFKAVALNDFSAFKKAVSKKTVGVLIELIQGEGGVNLVSLKYIKQVRNFCTKNNLLFLADEVQTGMGRTGKLFAFQYFDIVPDAFVLSKGLGAGVPISALVIKDKHANLFKPGMHASTFGGNPLVASASLETFKVIKDEALLTNVVKMGNYLKTELIRLKNKFDFIKEVRGAGLMIGVELKIETFPLFLEALKRKLIINSTHNTVLRIMPALNVKKTEIDQGLKIIEDIFGGIK